jgi:aryl carrier-like protein
VAGKDKLAGELADWYARHGAERVVLAGPGQPAGLRVLSVALDLADHAALRALLEEHCPDAVAYVAAALNDDVIGPLSVVRTDRAWATDGPAAAALDELTRDRPLSSFVLCSSLPGVTSRPGLGNHGVVDGFFEALADQRRGLGLPGTHVAVAPWAAAGGPDADRPDGAAAEQLRRSGGLRPLTLVATAAAVGSAPVSHTVVAALDWATLAPGDPLLRFLDPARSAAGHHEGEERPAQLQAELSGLSGTELDKALLAIVRSHAAAILGQPTAEDVAPDDNLLDLGMSSFTALELSSRLGEHTGVRLAPTILFDHPVPAALVARMRDALVAGNAPASGPQADRP